MVTALTINLAPAVKCASLKQLSYRRDNLKTLSYSWRTMCGF